MQARPEASYPADPSGDPVVLLAEYAGNAITDRCRNLAASCGLEIVTTCAPEQLLLTWIDDALTLCEGPQFKLQTRVDFASGKSMHRLQYGGGPGQPLARAVKISGAVKPLICDATGGLGRDAFVFATLGCEVVVLEQSPIVFALFADGLQRARCDPNISHLAKRIDLHHLDAKSLPAAWPSTRYPDTVYLDPMYPHDRKKSAAKKEMQLLQRLHLHEADEAALLQSAMATARQRVTVKRPLRAAPLSGCKPTGSIRSPNTRYDIYHGSAPVA